jgi:hypothetical protein
MPYRARCLLSSAVHQRCGTNVAQSNPRTSRAGCLCHAASSKILSTAREHEELQ